MVYCNESGNQIKLKNMIGKGGEAEIYAIENDPDHVAKIYTKLQHGTPQELHEKISCMVKNPPDDPTVNGPTKHRSIAWPTDILYDNQKKFCGIIMPYIDMKSFVVFTNYSNAQKRLQKFGGSFTWKHLIAIAYNLSSCFSAIHQKGYFIGDVNDLNILVHPQTPLTIIDCDSFQVKDPNTGKLYKCYVGRPEYTAPEMKDYKTQERTEYTDCFALGSLIFELLMEGYRPYQATGSLVDNCPNYRDKINKGHFPYTASSKGLKPSELSPPPASPPFEILSPEIQQLFIRAFDEGHNDPSKRPKAKEWASVLIKSLNDLIKCTQNDNHFYLKHLNQCPWCERAKKGHLDSFKSTLGMQIQLINTSGTSAPTAQDIDNYLRSFIEVTLIKGHLTNDEEDHILNIGQKLGLNDSHIKQMITDEMNKRGLSPSARGGPVLSVNIRYFKYFDIEQGETIEEFIEIYNKGTSVLRGTIKSNERWICIQGKDTLNIQPNQSQTVRVKVFTTLMPYSFSGSGSVSLITDGGDEDIYFDISIQKRPPLLKAVKTYVKYGSIGAAIGFLMRYILAVGANFSDWLFNYYDYMSWTEYSSKVKGREDILIPIVLLLFCCSMVFWFVKLKDRS